MSLLTVCAFRAAFALRLPRGPLGFSLKNSAYLFGEGIIDTVPYRPHSYPRLTLDFHTNKRIIDEVVRIQQTSHFIHTLKTDFSRLSSLQNVSETRFLDSQPI
jgi:hypothetical protein